MAEISRRVVLGGSLGAVAALQWPRLTFAQTSCVTGPLPAFLPNRLTVDCASRQNFRLFRDNATYLGLAGVVSMSFVSGGLGSYQAGNLFLFPWVKPRSAGQGRTWKASAPINATKVLQASPIPNAALPLDEYFCRLVLKAPWTSFIGFLVDQPYSKTDARLAWFGNVDKLADGKGVGIDWTSSNLNHPWFGGSRFIPGTDACNGRAWRQLIANGLNDASTGLC
jgi:hypothetical protein